MDSPDPDPGEEYQHTNTQLFNVLDEANRFKDATEMVAPYNAPPAGTAVDDGGLRHRLHQLPHRRARSPTDLRGVPPDHDGLHARAGAGDQRAGPGFGVFDHWFSEVPSQTMANRSFWTAATSSGFVVNRPMSNFMRHNAAETIFDRLERCGKTWKVYVLEPDPISFTGFIHMARLRDRFATNFVPFAEFEGDAADGTLPDFCLIEPNLLAGHGDYHPAFGRALVPGIDVEIDAPSSILAGEAFLARIYDAVDPPRPTRGRTPSTPCSSSASTSPAAPTTTSHRARAAARPRRSTPSSGSAFERSGYRVPAVIVSPWVPAGSVFTDEYRHTSMMATLRATWSLGEPFTAREAAARTFGHLLSLETPRPPETWPDSQAPPGTPLPGGAGRAPAARSAPSVATCATGSTSTHATTTASPILRPPIRRCRPRWPSTSQCTSAPGCSPGSCRVPQITERPAHAPPVALLPRGTTILRPEGKGSSTVPAPTPQDSHNPGRYRSR